MNEKLKYSKQVRESLENREKKYLNKYAKFSFSSKGRALRKDEENKEFRLCFQRDKDRIIHSKSFRRLKGKTQVFVFPVGDHYRTRLTHTLEVSQISRTIARALELNEDLAEAVALGHDLGHTPFGHLGERALREISKYGFHHAVQSERIAKNMNLTHEVCEGILKHSKGKGDILDDNMEKYASSLEAQIVRVADIMAYLNHDLEDAVRANLISYSDVPDSVIEILGVSVKDKFTSMVYDVIKNTKLAIENDFKGYEKRIQMSKDVLKAMSDLRTFLYEKVYEHKLVLEDLEKIYNLCKSLFRYFKDNPKVLLSNLNIKELYDDIDKVICDYIAGMTDNYATMYYKKLFLPKSWKSDEIFKLRKV
jgi:dGTPase